MKRLLLGGLVLAFVAGCGSDDGTRATLPVLAGGGGAKAAEMATDARLAAPTRYRFDGDLPELAGHAAAYTLEPGDAAKDRIDEVAEVLGTRTGLDVQEMGGQPWSFSRNEPDAGVASCAADGPCDTPKRPAGLPSRSEAEKQGRELLDRLGVDLDHATVHVDDGFSVWNVMADPEVDDLPVVGMSTSVAIGVGGRIQYANGWLGDPTKGDDYPLIGAQSALKKLQEQQVTTMMMPVCDDTAASCAAPEPMTVDVTEVRLGLQLFSYGEPDEPGYLVPSYVFSTDDGGQLPVIAVEDRYLTKPEEPRSKPVPDPREVPNGDTCSGAASGSGSTGVNGSATATEPEQGGSVEVCGDSSVAAGTDATWSVKSSCGKTMDVDFGDGVHDTVAIGEVTHRYERDGRYQVTFAPVGCSTSVSTEVVVGDSDQPTMTIEPQPAPDEPTKPPAPSPEVQGASVDGQGGAGHE
jgi:hypothetical protein